MPEREKGRKIEKAGKIERREKLYGIKQIFLKMVVGISSVLPPAYKF